MQWPPRRDRKFSVPSDVLSPALFDVCNMNSDTSYSVQAASTPSIYYQAEMEDNRLSFHCDSSSNVSETSTNATMDSQMTCKFRPNPLKLDNTSLDLVRSPDSADDDYDEDDILTPKILPTSRKGSREGPVFFISGSPDRQPSSQGMKDKIDKAITSGSSYLRLPAAVERRRHSWMSG
jgi:hypothetical protein